MNAKPIVGVSSKKGLISQLGIQWVMGCTTIGGECNRGSVKSVIGRTIVNVVLVMEHHCLGYAGSFAQNCRQGCLL